MLVATAADFGLLKLYASGVVDSNERVVVVLTGTGLKATDKIAG